ncbi:hypothetical protein BDW02DRAFT_64098 [Decorospora gaudefroyi]|uniref:Uncharacterized protein n=1 Tax=Decorospora gaudefroyi TaxID=184978 RepID=A0A6A5KCS1_9PLEO|nr:hypothetical protein BDW02DRAFT_64098 [Decorospora gaudefroyi]
MMDIPGYEGTIRHLKSEQRSVFRNSDRVSDRSAKHNRIPHNRTPQASSLASNVYSRLPRELRNRIYTFCIQGPYDNEVIVRRTAYGSTHRFAHLIREPCGQHAYQWVEDPITSYLDVKRLGHEVAREMLECYYWLRTFKFAHHELCLLGPFLKSDNFGLGMLPAQYARRLQVQIRPLDFTFLLGEQRLFEEKRCCKAIETLAAIQTARTEVAIEIDLAQGSLDEADYDRFSSNAAQFMRRMARLIEELREKGMRIRVGKTGA